MLHHTNYTAIHNYIYNITTMQMHVYPNSSNGDE